MRRRFASFRHYALLEIGIVEIEFGAENRPEGNKIVLRAQWIFGK
jgi:hypothetical protein